MALPLIELHGTWKEIEAQLPDFQEQRLHVIVFPEAGVSAEPAEARSPLDAALAEIWNTTPEESWEQMPADFGDNIDHYLYGTPKRP